MYPFWLALDTLTFHSHSELYLSPWGYTSDLCMDDAIFREIGAQISRYNDYPFGNSYVTIYPTNGTAMDWNYGDLSLKPKIFSLTSEVGNSDDGFWPPIERIIPLCEGQLWANIFISLCAGSVPMLERYSISDTSGNSSGYPDPSEIVTMAITIRNRGLDRATSVFSKLEAISGISEIFADSVFLGDIESFSSISSNIAFRFRLDSSLVMDEEVELIVRTFDPNGYAFTDTVRFRVGTPDFAHSDDLERSLDFTTTNDWEWGAPTTGPRMAHSGEYLFATKLHSNHSDNILSVLTTPSIHLSSELMIARLSFWHWYTTEIEAPTYYDGGNVKVSIDDGIYFHVSPYGGYDGELWEHNPMPGEGAFSGSSNGWIQSYFDLTPYIGHSVRFRFDFGSDPGVNEAGWYIDDIEVYGFNSFGIVEAIQTIDEPILFIYPNPFNMSCSFDAPPNATIELFDVKGRLIDKLQENQHFWRPASSISSGVYLVRVVNDGKSHFQRLVLIK